MMNKLGMSEKLKGQLTELEDNMSKYLEELGYDS